MSELLIIHIITYFHTAPSNRYIKDSIWKNKPVERNSEPMGNVVGSVPVKNFDSLDYPDNKRIMISLKIWDIMESLLLLPTDPSHQCKTVKAESYFFAQ